MENRTPDLDHASGEIDQSQGEGHQTCPIYHASISRGCRPQKIVWIHFAKDRSFAAFAGNWVIQATGEKLVSSSSAWIE